jgi:hypothetical protein
MGRISRDIEDICQGHLTISEMRRKVFFRQEGFALRGRNNLPLNQFLDGEDCFFLDNLFGFKKSIKTLPQITEKPT